jgi:hypothetical protein
MIVIHYYGGLRVKLGLNEILTGQPAHSGEGEKGGEGLVVESEEGHTEEGKESFHSENETSE